MLCHQTIVNYSRMTIKQSMYIVLSKFAYGNPKLYLRISEKLTGNLYIQYIQSFWLGKIGYSYFWFWKLKQLHTMCLFHGIQLYSISQSWIYKWSIIIMVQVRLQMPLAHYYSRFITFHLPYAYLLSPSQSYRTVVSLASAILPVAFIY